MKKVASIIASVGFLGGLSQISSAQHGQLFLENFGVGIFGSEYAGTVLMQFQPTGGNLSDPFYAYCTVLNVTTGVPNNWGATMLTTDNFTPEPPADNGAVNARYQGLYGANLALDDIIVGGELAFVANAFGSSGLAAPNAAAQVAIWDLAQGGNGTFGDSFFGAGGTAQNWDFGDAGATMAAAMAEAAAAYNNGNPLYAQDTWYKADVDQNGFPASQDFLVPTGTPEPFTMGIGAVGIGLALRRRMKRSA